MDSTSQPPQESKQPQVLPYASPPSPVSHSNAVARAAWISGLLALCGIAAPCLLADGNTIGVPLLMLLLVASFSAVILGVWGRRKSSENDVGGRKRSNFAIVEGATALLLALFVSWLLPQLGQPKERANRVKCASSLRQIGQAILLYASDHAGQLPAGFQQLLTGPDAVDPTVFVCPSSDHDAWMGATTQQVLAVLAQKGHWSYVYLGVGRTLTKLTDDMILVYEDPVNHEGDGANFLFADGHVEWVITAEAKRMIEDLNSGHNPPRPLGQQQP